MLRAQHARLFLRRYYYRHHGLTLNINQALPRLAPADEQTTDITIEVLEPGRVEEPGSFQAGELPWVMTDPPRTMWRAQTNRGNYLRLRYAVDDEWAEFVVDERGAIVWVSRSPSVLLREATELLLGPVFSCVLAQRGRTCLHAAVVKLGSHVVALVGPSGAGKSTTAVALIQDGGLLVSDDVAVLTEHAGRVGVVAGAPRLRMRPDSARSLVGSFDSLEPMWADGRPGLTKRYLHVAGNAAIADAGGFPLDILYFLAPWSDEIVPPLLRQLTSVQALPKLMAHRHMVGALEQGSDRRDFGVLGRLVETVLARELVRPAGLETTEQTVAAIVSDVSSLG